MQHPSAPRPSHDATDGHGIPGHRHPHPPDDPSGHPRIAIVGAGRAGSALALALHRAGWPVVAVASRDSGRRDRLAALIPGAAGVSLAEIPDVADLILVTVPDDAIASVAATLRCYGGQAIVHTSGAVPAAALDPARAAGTLAGSFHPLVPFADLEHAVAALHGATIALEGDGALLPLLGEMAEAIGGQPVLLPPGGKAAYHAAAVLAAGGFIALLDAIAELGRGAGLDERGSLAIYGPLIRQGLANAERIGVSAALTGPLVRGDAGTVRGHLDAMRRLAPGAVELYVAAGRREIALAVARGDLDAAGAAAIGRLLDEARPPA